MSEIEHRRLMAVYPVDRLGLHRMAVNADLVCRTETAFMPGDVGSVRLSETAIVNWMPFVDGLVVYLDADGDDLDEMAFAIQQANILGIDIEYRELPTMRSTPTRWQKIADAARLALS